MHLVASSEASRYDDAPEENRFVDAADAMRLETDPLAMHLVDAQEATRYEKAP